MTKAQDKHGLGSNERLWPLVCLLLATAFVPAGCVIWFMNKAIHNEELAARQRRADLERILLNDASLYLRSFWLEETNALDAIALQASQQELPELFKTYIQANLADTLIFFEENGERLTPATPLPPTEPEVWQKQWKLTQRMEFVEKNLEKAEENYAVLATISPNIHLAARALLAQARCLHRRGHTEQALIILTQTLTSPTYTGARDQWGRFLQANGRMLALELIGADQHHARSETISGLLADLENYQTPHMPTVQRRFLMQRLLEVVPAARKPVTFNAEMLAGRVSLTQLPESNTLSEAALSGYWQLRAPRGRVLALFDEKKLIARFEQGMQESKHGSALKLIRPGTVPFNLERQSLGLDTVGFPGWRLTLLPLMAETDSLTESRISSYHWTAVLVLLTLFIVVLLLARYQRMQMRLTRLKNELVTTVTHELKTPLSSMRMLVDTLLDGHYNNPQITREYLELIQKENTRLSRLIENFLSFSRLERNHQHFNRVPLNLNDIATAALETIEAKLRNGGFTVTSELGLNLPPILGNADALVTVALNFLENAYKYSGQRKEIKLRTFLENDFVCLSVADKGIGLSRKDCKRIFTRFYRVDQSLSRKADGVGLGLNIVHHIVQGHLGTLSVDSQPGEGSTFTVCLPCSHHAQG